VREFYRLNHAHQTYDFVKAKKTEYLSLDRKVMEIWEAMEFLNQLVDDSDPDGDFTQIEHLLMCAEAARRDGKPDWFVVTCLIHDLGKILCLFGEPQWAVVGDTFPVGCQFSEKCVFPRFFEANPDFNNPKYNTEYGIYSEKTGLSNIHLSWGHDEYLYHVVKDYLPDEALAMIRFHSFYPWHKEEAYGHLTDEKDAALLPWVRAFNPYDLYTKADLRPDGKALEPYYRELLGKFFPKPLKW
jgi:inositol oxygenase